MERDESIDALRGLAAILVVLGHAIPYAAAVFHGGPGLVKIDSFLWVPFDTATNLLLSAVKSFHMPLFAFVSGLVLWPRRNRPLGAQLLRRVRGLLVPYFAWFVVIYSVSPGISPVPSRSFGPALLDAALGRGGGLWFLYALFVCAVALECLSRIPFPRVAIAGSALIAVGLSTGLLFAVPNVMYMGYALWIYPFFALGYLLGPLKARSVAHRRLLAVVGLSLFAPLLYLRHPIDLPELQPIRVFAVKMHGAGLPGGYALSTLLPQLCATAAILAVFGLYIGRKGKATQVQAWLGRKSLGVYAAQGPILWWFFGMGVRNPLTLFLLVLGGSVALTAAIERIPLLNLVFLGQPRKGRARGERHPECTQDAVQL